MSTQIEVTCDYCGKKDFCCYGLPVNWNYITLFLGNNENEMHLCNFCSMPKPPEKSVPKTVFKKIYDRLIKGKKDE
jgi:hypothetical protein